MLLSSSDDVKEMSSIVSDLCDPLGSLLEVEGDEDATCDEAIEAVF